MVEDAYDRLYRSEKNVFGGPLGRPSIITKLLSRHLKEGKVLELGAGQGRNSLWLAHRGLSVYALELSQAGVDFIRERSEKEHVSVIAQKTDVREGLEGEYEAIVSTFMTHHLSRPEAYKVIEDMKAHTKPGGYNALEVFTKEGDFFKENPETDRFYPALGELRSLYSDWEILKYEETDSTAAEKRPDGRQKHNIAARILARRTS